MREIHIQSILSLKNCSEAVLHLVEIPLISSNLFKLFMLTLKHRSIIMTALPSQSWNPALIQLTQPTVSPGILTSCWFLLCGFSQVRWITLCQLTCPFVLKQASSDQQILSRKRVSFTLLNMVEFAGTLWFFHLNTRQRAGSSRQ